MANDFDQFPLYDPLIRKDSTNMSDIWIDSMATFYQNLVGYLTQFGILPPNLTTAQRNSINSPMNGQMIYNTTLDTMQYYKVSTGTWISF